MKKYYLLLLTNENDNGASLVSLLNNAGLGQMLLGRGGDLQTNLWLITKVRKEKNEVIQSLKELPAIKKVRIIEFNDPVAPDVIPKARFLVESMGFDTTLIKDEEWQLYLQANLERKFLYFLDLADEKPYDRRPKIFSDQSVKVQTLILNGWKNRLPIRGQMKMKQKYLAFLILK